MFSYEFLSVRFLDEIVEVMINNPNKLNALSPKVLVELRECFLNLESSSQDIRGALLTSAGDRAFVAGADIKEQSRMSPDEGKKFSALGQEVNNCIEKVKFPVIACVDGFALGGGCEIAMACDFIYATENSIFGQPEVRLGLIPGFGGCIRLAQRVGLAKAKELIYTGLKINGREAFRIGLVNQIFKNKADLLAAATETLRVISKNSPYAVSLSKEVLVNSEGFHPTEAFAMEKEAFFRAFSSEEKIEGVSAFIEKREPVFN